MATLKQIFIEYTALLSTKLNDLDGRVGVGNLHTDDSLYYNTKSGLLKNNTAWEVEKYAMGVGERIITLKNSPDLLLFISVNGVILEDPETQYNFEDRTITIVHPNLPGAYNVTVAYRYRRYSDGVYGFEFNRTHAAPEVTRIGNMELHKTLPIQSRIKRCIQNDAGGVVYYLDADNSAKRDDQSIANLDGSDGQVKSEVPKHYEYYEEEGEICRALFSLTPFENSKVVKKYYIGSFIGSLDRSSNKLSSVVNSGANYRGGNNNAALDAAAQTLLGKPATAISRINFDTYANNRSSRHIQKDYDMHRNLYWLITCEFATRNHQAAFDPTLTPEGYKKGGLGSGATNISSAEWTAFNSQYPAINCGQTVSLGNNTGVKNITLNDFPTVGETRTTQVNSYRGIENYFGDLWEWVNGINFKIEGGVAHGYVSIDGAISNTNYDGYRYVGELTSVSGYISEVVFGEYGDILPSKTTGGSSTTFYCDYYYHGGDGLRTLPSGGSLNRGSYAGSACSVSNYAPTNTTAHIGSRLCFR